MCLFCQCCLWPSSGTLLSLPCNKNEGSFFFSLQTTKMKIKYSGFFLSRSANKYFSHLASLTPSLWILCLYWTTLHTPLNCEKFLYSGFNRKLNGSCRLALVSEAMSVWLHPNMSFCLCKIELPTKCNTFLQNQKAARDIYTFVHVSV